MNKNLCLEFTNSFDYIEKGQAFYSKLLATIKQRSNNITSQILPLLEADSYKRAKDFFILKDGISRLQGMLQPEKYKELVDAIERERQLAVMLNKCCHDYTNTKDARYLTAIYNIAKAEEKYLNNLSHAFTMVEEQFGILLVSAVFNNQVSLEDVRELATSLKHGSNLQKNMEQLVINLERRNQKEEEQNKAVEEEKQNKVVEEEKQNQAEQDDLTLQEKIDKVNYSLDGNLVAEVQELTIEDRIHQIDASIMELTGKQKLSFKDIIALHTLEQERLQLEAYSSTLDNMKLSRSQTKRNKKMKIATMKLQENNNKLEKSRENYAQYRSKIARFFSARYQKKLNEKIQKLQEKRGTIQEKQKMSAIANFDKKSGKIVKKSRVLGVENAIGEYKDNKVAELKELRDQIVGEFQSLRKDYSRFRSSKQDVVNLQNKTGVMPEDIVNINQYRIEQISEKVA